MKLTASDIRARTHAGHPLTVLTCYDYPTAVVEDECGIDILLVGDSVGTNVLGYSDISQVTVADMAHHVRAVSRGAKRAFVLCDMPFNSFATAQSALENARLFMSCGANGVKMEGEGQAVDIVKHVCDHGIAVCAHIGYTPQTHAKAAVQGRDVQRALDLVAVAHRLERAGASMMVLELIPDELAAEITRALSIPTIGIGAGMHCTGQVQVVNDVLGMSQRVFRHAKRFANIGQDMRAAVQQYAREVSDGTFPTKEHAATLPSDVLAQVVRSIRSESPGGPSR